MISLTHIILYVKFSQKDNNVYSVKQHGTNQVVHNLTFSEKQHG